MNHHAASLHLRSILWALQVIADEAGVRNDVRSNFDATLQALPPAYRTRVQFTLEIMRAFSDDLAFHAAANLISRRAAELWSDQPADDLRSEPPRATRTIVVAKPSLADALRDTVAAFIRAVAVPETA